MAVKKANATAQTQRKVQKNTHKSQKSQKPQKGAQKNPKAEKQASVKAEQHVKVKGERAAASTGIKVERWQTRSGSIEALEAKVQQTKVQKHGRATKAATSIKTKKEAVKEKGAVSVSGVQESPQANHSAHGEIVCLPKREGGRPSWLPEDWTWNYHVYNANGQKKKYFVSPKGKVARSKAQVEDIVGQVLFDQMDASFSLPDGWYITTLVHKSSQKMQRRNVVVDPQGKVYYNLKYAQLAIEHQRAKTAKVEKVLPDVAQPKSKNLGDSTLVASAMPGTPTDSTKESTDHEVTSPSEQESCNSPSRHESMVLAQDPSTETTDEAMNASELFTTASEKLCSLRESFASLKIMLDSLPPSSLLMYSEERCTLMHMAASREDDNALQLCQYIGRLWSRRSKIPNITTALFFAARAGNADVCEYLVSLKSDVNCVNPDGRTPLFEAISFHSSRHQDRGYDTIERLIELRANVHHADDQCQTPIFCAADCTGNSRYISLLLKAGALADVHDARGRTPIFNAAAAGNVQAIQLLARANADVHKIDRQKMNALRLAIKSSQNQAAMVLLADYAVGLPPVEASRQYRDEHGDGTCMSMAKDCGLNEAVAYLSSMSACYDCARSGTKQEFEAALKMHPGGLGLDEHGRNLLHWVAGRRNDLPGTLDILELLISWGWNVDERDYSEKTPLFFAVESGNMSSMSYLLETGADANSKDVHGFCPLFYALGSGASADVIATLTRHTNSEMQSITLQQAARVAGL